MKLSPRQTERTFNFVMSEIVRHSKMSWDEMKLLGIDGFLAPQAVGPDGEKRMMGREAARRLRVLAEQALEDSAFRRRLDPKAAFDSVLKGFGTEYVRPDRLGSTAKQDRARLAHWIAVAGESCQTLTRFIPCQIGLKRVGKVSIGPVTFGPVAAAVDGLAGPLNASRETERGDHPGRTDLIADLCETYLRSFSDVAEVTVSGCDPVTSRRLAEEAVQAALNSLHLLAGAYPTKNMRGGGPAMASVETASVAVADDDRAVLSWQKSWEGASIHSGFWASLTKPSRAQMVEAVGVAISTILDRTDAEFAAARYLDASAWYSDAVREKSLPAAIVKHLTAMERLLWTGETGPGVTRRLSERSAALCFSPVEWDFEELVAEVREAYDLRSGILHGRLSGSDPKVIRSHRLCERVARALRETWLARYGDGFSTPTNVEKAKVHFDGFVAAVKRDNAARKAHGLSPMSS